MPPPRPLVPLLAALLLAVPALVGLAPTSAVAADSAFPSPAVSWLQLRGGIVPIPRVDRPYRLPSAYNRLPDPLFADTGLWRRPPSPPPVVGLRMGAATWDRSSSAWFLPVSGMVVRLTAQRQLHRLLDGIDSLDVDLQTARGLLVARTGDDRIILRRMGEASHVGRTLLSGGGFFEPRLSPNGRRVLVSQSHAEGGRMWVVELDGRKRDVGQGYGPTWMPGSDSLVFSRVEGRSQRIRAAELWHLNLATSAERPLTATADIAEVEPTVSDDGHWLAYADARNGDLCVAAWPRQGR